MKMYFKIRNTKTCTAYMLSSMFDFSSFKFYIDSDILIVYCIFLSVRMRTFSATSASKCDRCGKATSIIRTIYLPNENADSMQAIVESLRRQLAEHAKLAAEQKAAYQEDRRIREQEAQVGVRTECHGIGGFNEQSCIR